MRRVVRFWWLVFWWYRLEINTVVNIIRFQSARGNWWVLCSGQQIIALGLELSRWTMTFIPYASTYSHEHFAAEKMCGTVYGSSINFNPNFLTPENAVERTRGTTHVRNVYIKYTHIHRLQKVLYFLLVPSHYHNLFVF